MKKRITSYVLLLNLIYIDKIINWFWETYRSGSLILDV